MTLNPYATKTGVQTLTNKTLTSPKINENVVMDRTSTQLNRVDATSSIQGQLNAKVDKPTGTTYYIDATNGRDNSGNGSQSSPWKSLNKACAVVTTTGDIIHVNAGTYIETVQSVLAVGVSIEGVGITSIIKSHLATVDNDNGAIVHLLGATSGENGNQSISYLKFDGDALTGYGAIRNNKRSNVSIHHCTFIDFKYYGLWFDGNGSGTLPSTYATGNSFHDNTITNCSGYYSGNGYGALRIDGQAGFLCYNNYMTQLGRGYGLNGYLIKAVSGFNKGLKIYNNTILKEPFDGANWDFSIELWNSRGGCEIYNNTIEGEIDLGGDQDNNDAGGYGFCYKVYNNVIGSTSYNANYEQGIQLELSISKTWTGGTYIYNNLLRNLHTAIWTASAGSCSFSDIYIYYNVIYNVGYLGASNTSKGIYLGSGSTNTYHNLNVLNNVIYSGTPPSSNLDGIRLEVKGIATNITIRNNIIQGFTNNTGLYAQNSTIDIMSVENNNFYGNGYNAPSNLPDMVVGNGNSITNLTNQNNIVTIPGFVSAGTDFHLAVGSGCTNTGIHITSPTILYDYDDTTIANPPDIGAYEKQ